MANIGLSAFHESALKGLAGAFPDLAAQWEAETQAGLKLAHDTLPDYSPNGVEQRAGAIHDLLDRHGRLGSPETAGERLNADILSFYLRHGLGPSWIGTDGNQFRFHDYPVNHFFGAQSQLLFLVSRGLDIRTLEDAQDCVRRLEAVPAAIDDLVESVTHRRALGFVPPTRAIARVLDEIQRFIAQPIEANAVFMALRDRIRRAPIPDDAKSRLVARIHEITAGTVRSAYERLSLTMADLAASASEAPGVWQFEDGDAYYAFLLRSHTTTGHTAEQIHSIGQTELERLRTRIEEQFRALGMRHGTMAENFRDLLSDATHGYEDNEGGRARALSDFEGALELGQRCAAPLFRSLPAAGVRIEPIAPALENSLAHHYTPARQGSATGIFHLNLKHAVRGPRWEAPAITFHETVPGHHMQIALAQELAELPFFRRVVRFNAFAEGWAKYAETLPFETGSIDDPHAALGRMRMELYSTVNLMLDTGIHAKRWSIREGVSFLEREIGADETFAQDLVDRITVMPGQACAYKIGMMAMLGHRRRMELARGANFDIKAFHALMLDQGSVPLEVLARIVDSTLAIEN